MGDNVEVRAAADTSQQQRAGADAGQDQAADDGSTSAMARDPLAGRDVKLVAEVVHQPLVGVGIGQVSRASVIIRGSRVPPSGSSC